MTSLPHAVPSRLSHLTAELYGRPDWMMYYVPGPKARAEYVAFNTRPRRRAEHPAAVPQRVIQAKESAPASPPAADVPTADAQALVQYFRLLPISPRESRFFMVYSHP